MKKYYVNPEMDLLLMDLNKDVLSLSDGEHGVQDGFDEFAG